MSDWTALLDVQRHDTTTEQLRHRRTHLPQQASLDAAEAHRAEAEQQAVEVAAVVADLARRQRHLEAEVADLEAKETDVGRKLAVGTVPREVQTLADELEKLKARRSGVEDEVLAVMEELEPLADELAALQAAAAEHAERRDAAQVEAVAARADLDAELARVIAERAALADAVAPELLAEYDRLRARLGGVAVAELVHGHCSGCNLALPASELSRIRQLPADARVVCEECGRLLVHST